MKPFWKTLGFALLLSSATHAGDRNFLEMYAAGAGVEPGQRGYLLAQADTEAYDPFADYSEFDEASEEEADIFFFKHGRFFTIAFNVGYRSFTENLSNLYTPSISYGLNVSYFFDLRYALEFGFRTGDYGFQVATPSEALFGNVSLTFLSLNMKYYTNTQNVTKGLADINPYLVGGFSQVYRTYSLQGVDGFGRESAFSLDGGLGVEFPIMQRKSYIGLQGTFHYVNFKDENNPIRLPSGTLTNAQPRGDTYDVLAILGLNF